jgi:peptidoglycan/xylan/chitin deacetylase (PgdA/CDA1 family)
VLAPSRVSRPPTRALAQVVLGCGLLLSGYLVFAWRTSIASPEGAPGSDPGTTEQSGEPAPGLDSGLPLAGADADPLLGPTALDPVGEQPRAVLAPDAVRWPAGDQRPHEVATLPILMYHHINDLPRTVSDPFLKDLTVSPPDFRRQLELLQTNEAQTVSLAALMEYLQGGDPIPSRAVVLTFDDGYDDNYRFAYPLLREFGMTGTFFVVANLVGQPGYMTWEQLRDMQLNGMAVESHSLDHIDLSVLPRAELQRQLTESRRVLELNLMRPVRFLNYPSGRYNPQVIAAARTAGYQAAVTVNYGVVQRRSTAFELNRVRVKGADTPESLAVKTLPQDWKYTRGMFGR